MKAVFGIFTRFLHYDGPRIRAYSGTLYIRAPDTRTSTTKASRCCGKVTEALEFNMVYAFVQASLSWSSSLDMYRGRRFGVRGTSKKSFKRRYDLCPQSFWSFMRFPTTIRCTNQGSNPIAKGDMRSSPTTKGRGPWRYWVMMWVPQASGWSQPKHCKNCHVSPSTFGKAIIDDRETPKKFSCTRCLTVFASHIVTWHT